MWEAMDTHTHDVDVDETLSTRSTRGNTSEDVARKLSDDITSRREVQRVSVSGSLPHTPHHAPVTPTVIQQPRLSGSATRIQTVPLTQVASLPATQPLAQRFMPTQSIPIQASATTQAGLQRAVTAPGSGYAVVSGASSAMTPPAPGMAQTALKSRAQTIGALNVQTVQKIGSPRPALGSTRSTEGFGSATSVQTAHTAHAVEETTTTTEEAHLEVHAHTGKASYRTHAGDRRGHHEHH